MHHSNTTSVVSPMQLFLGSLVKENLAGSSCHVPLDMDLALVDDNAHIRRTAAADMLDRSLCDGDNEEISRRGRRLRKSCALRWLPSEDHGSQQNSKTPLRSTAPPSPPKRRLAKEEQTLSTRWAESPADDKIHQESLTKFSAPIRPRRYLEEQR